MKLIFINADEPPVDYSHGKLLLPLSGGIMSAAALCFLGEYHPTHLKPRALHLYHTNFQEQSPDTRQFVADCVRYAERAFPFVKVKIETQSVNQFFLEKQLIPHPTTSPCTVQLKSLPQAEYAHSHAIDWTVEGFVRSPQTENPQTLFYGKREIPSPQIGITEEANFALVQSVIGWYPSIYDIFENGERVFKFNNCLPCKNMNASEIEKVARYFPGRAQQAALIAAQIPNASWGHDNVPDIFRCDTCERFN